MGADALPRSTLSQGLVPTGPRRAVKQVVGYKSTLGINLVPNPRSERLPQSSGVSKYVSKLGPDLAPVLPTSEAAVGDEPTRPPPKGPNMLAHLPPGPSKPRLPLGGGRGPTCCFFTGDEFVIHGTQPQMQLEKGPPEPLRCIYSQDDLPERTKEMVRLPATPSAAWLPAHPSDEMQRLREWKTRCVMPEDLRGIPGLGAKAASNTPRGKDAAWENEREWREMIDGRERDQARLVFENAQKAAKNQAVTDYGERLPARGKGDVFAPFAPRS